MCERLRRLGDPFSHGGELAWPPNANRAAPQPRASARRQGLARPRPILRGRHRTPPAVPLGLNDLPTSQLMSAPVPAALGSGYLDAGRGPRYVTPPVRRIGSPM